MKQKGHKALRSAVWKTVSTVCECCLQDSIEDAAESKTRQVYRNAMQALRRWAQLGDKATIGEVPRRGT